MTEVGDGEIGILHIEVRERPSIDTGASDLFIQECSGAEGGNSVVFDLEMGFDHVDDNGTSVPTDVVYYASEADYLNGDAIPNADSYSVSDGQVIYAEVINTDTYCSSTEAVLIPVSVESRPSVDIMDYHDTVICVDTDPSTPVEGGDYGQLTIDTGLDGEGLSFIWTYEGATLSEQGPSITVGGTGNPLQAGVYSVQVLDLNTLDGDGNNCGSDIDTITILESNPPEFSAAPTSLGFEGGHSLMVYNVTGNGDYEFSVDNGPWTELPSTGELEFDGLSAGVHTVYGRDRNGCGVTASVGVAFIDFPPFFTPNGDGYNDTWNIIGLDTELNRGARVLIFDRYGKLLKQLSPSSEGWDGTYNGSPLPSGDYWFSVEYLEPGIPGTGTAPAQPTPRTFKNHFTLKR